MRSRSVTPRCHTSCRAPDALPSGCSLSPHIVLRELGLPFDLEAVDTKAQKTAGGANFTAINPKKYVPVLQLDDGQLLTEGAAIVQYLADRKPDAMLAPPNGSMDRYRLQEWLNYVASELHKSYGPVFRASEDQRPPLREALVPKLDYVASHLEKRQCVMGDRLTVADAYLFTVLNRTNLALALLGKDDDGLGGRCDASALAARHGVTLVNAPGTVDAGYRGEIKVTLLNTDRDQPVSFSRGDRTRASSGSGTLHSMSRRMRTGWPGPASFACGTTHIHCAGHVRTVASEYNTEVTDHESAAGNRRFRSPTVR